MLTLFRLLSRWPLGLLHVLGAGLGWLTWLLSPTYRRRLHRNAAQAGVAPAQARAAVAEAGRMVMELPWLWMRPADRPLGDKLRWQGEACIEEAHRRGKGIVFLTPHLGCFEVTAQGYAERYGATHGPITVLYRPPRKAAIRPLVEAARRRPGLATAPATLAGVRQMIRALRQGQAVGLLPDQVPPEGMGVWAPFFGRPAYTMTLAARLAQQTGASIVLAWGERLRRGAGYVIHLEPFDEPLPDLAADQGQSAATAINRAMERLILRCPGQYLWGYHRYKQPRREAAPAGAAESS
ncbi:lysophospholipid acyltransferase family protein [Caldimonas thermodepolymerans]|jgi:Lauroyl/myristoyl acyltransferase|uniref:KDO2-lipid IV(A) lauroyltransferase n=1 Tax=Caldimonas thermodepolymerans TaxID=215580 RepID=A0A2S5T5M4_9BURK|nr:lysophospholipid acyltransferase family protein [Caldimonas thermodepolymerans]PPE70252.1 lipid A biosynthesis acyltransferase [Caldimonas thermodepolymerans]QPC32246.1 lysophospholipid acyltransferase family protein [Caldimonas thermodepolymerans]RDH98137.1 KDO2-lipid IV(A) lauroyltransferase [Caldimonas thermodepolymerans]TCP08088.1 KDO2-lipid IV(A) lauroyltransferase [Caldimonas thermodepolymerans]UZG48790.1 lysophospholipid acyltransferase family protein [Caldimonas thermodepolymerans]